MVSLLNNRVFGPWEEAEVQTVNSHKYRETMKIHQNQDLLTVRHQYKPLHTTALLCYPRYNTQFKNSQTIDIFLLFV